MKKVLLLGSGMVARPLILYLLRKNFFITIATPLFEKAVEMVAGFSNCEVIRWSADDDEKLSLLVASHNVVVSLIPYTYHVQVAQKCILHKKNMLTTSYVSPQMKALDSEAKQAGILILNEMGLDPGIDHMSAKKIIDYVHSKGGKIDTFYSFCGALPAPEATNNPFKYKFSWSPAGVLMAGRNKASYRLNNHLINIESIDLFKDVRKIRFPGFGEMEVYPNRDSLSYIDIYGIKEVETIMRGTIRYPGWCNIMDTFKQMDLFSDEISSFEAISNLDFILKHCQCQSKDEFCSQFKLDKNKAVYAAMQWAGFFDTHPFDPKKMSPFDFTAALMIPKMTITDQERDMVQMIHYFNVSYPDGSKENILSDMLVYGTPNEDTAVAKTVAYPAAIGVEMILNNEIDLKGVHIPINPQIYQKVLAQLEGLGFKLSENFNPDNGIFLE